nr:MAG TPA: Glycine rich protein family [Caudoviricetes sp.]
MDNMALQITIVICVTMIILTLISTLGGRKK